MVRATARRWSVAVFVPLVGALLGFAYEKPLTVFEAYGALRLRLSDVYSQHVQAGPYRLRYLEAGAGPPLVLVHGLGSSAVQDWGGCWPPSVGVSTCTRRTCRASASRSVRPRPTTRSPCRHVPMADCPEAFDRELMPFLVADAPAAP